MNFDFSDDQKMLRDQARKFLDEKCSRKAVRDAYPGYFMGSTTEADNSCRLENLLVMHEVAFEGAH